METTNTNTGRKDYEKVSLFAGTNITVYAEKIIVTDDTDSLINKELESPFLREIKKGDSKVEDVILECSDTIAKLYGLDVKEYGDEGFLEDGTPVLYKIADYYIIRHKGRVVLLIGIKIYKQLLDE